MRIRLQTVCKNEEDIMPFFIQHYKDWVDEIVICDGHSTDNSIKIAKELGGDKVTIRNVDDGAFLNDEWLMAIRNVDWKRDLDNIDWQIVCDMDEFLYHPNILQKLEEFKKSGVTLPIVNGYDMYSKEFPKPGIPLTKQVTNGIRDSKWLDKFMIFNPKECAPNYSIGCHDSRPSGNVVKSTEPMFMLHYKRLGLEYLLKKSKYSLERLSKQNLEHGWAYHYNDLVKHTEEDFNKQLMSATPVINTPPDRSYLFQQDDFVYREMFEWNVYNVFEADIKGKNVLDIGGQYGMFTIKAHDLGAKRIIAVEACPTNYLRYMSNTADLPNVKSVNCACSHITGDKVTIENASGGSRIGHGTDVVTTVSLVDIVGWFPKDEDIVLKMDIEGAEFDILLNTPWQVIRRFNTIVIEIHGPLHAGGHEGMTIELLEKHITGMGFHIAHRGGFYTDYTDGRHIDAPDVFVYKFQRI